MTEAHLTSTDSRTIASIEQNAEGGNVQGALQEVRDYLNQNPNNPQLVSELTAEMERNGVLPLLMVEAFGNNVDLSVELSAYDDNGDGILSRTELVNGAGDNASILFGQFLAERLDLTETGESIDTLSERVPLVLNEYQSFQPQLTSVELAIGFMTPIQTGEGTVTVFDLIDNAHGGSRDGIVSYRDIEHFIYWAEHDSSNGWAQAILDAGLTIEDLRAFQNNYDAPPYNILRIGGNSDITVDSLLSGSGYNVETGSIALRDVSGRISEIHYADGTTRSFAYDPTGLLVSVVQPDGSRVTLNPTTQTWEVDGQPFAKNIVVTPDGQMTVTRDGVSQADGSPITSVDYIGLDGTVTTTESRSVLTENQLHDRATVINDALASGNTDLVITLLSSMTSADLLRLSDYYRVHYGVDLDRDGNVSETDRSLIHSSLFRVGDSEADFVSAVDHAMSLTDTARREEALRNIFSTMSSEQIAQFEQRWSDQHGGQSFRNYLFGDTVNLSNGTRRSLEIYMQGTDVNFVAASNETGIDAPVYMNNEDAVQLGIIALENRNLEMFAEAMRTASPEARAYFAENGEGRAAFLTAFGRNNARANDYVEWGELTLATIIPENANALWTYTDRISSALINIPEDQRALYSRGRELAESNTSAESSEDQRALDYYNELNTVLRNYAHGALAGFNDFQFRQWEAQLLYGDSLITQVMSLEQTHTLGIGGTYHDRDAVMSVIENMSREDFDLLFVQDTEGNFPYREVLFDSLDTMLSDEEMVEVRGIISRMVEARDAAQETTATSDAALTGETAPDGYQLALEQGQRFLDEIIAENSWDAVIGWKYEPTDIINGIINMTPEEQELYRQNAYVEGKGNYRDYIDGLIRDRLDNGPEMQLAALLLRQIVEGGEPEMGPLARVLYADLTNASGGQLMTDIQAIFDPNTLNDETLSAAERDLIARIQAGETIEISNGFDSVSIGRDYFVRIASEALVDANLYVPFHATFESLSQNPEHVLWSLFDPEGNHTLPLDVRIRLAESNDQQVLQAVLDASPEELLALQREIATGGGEFLSQILSELDEEDRQTVLQVLTNVLSSWDGQTALPLSPEDEIRLITLGVWEDSARAESMLSEMSPEEIAAVQANYSAKYGDMHADVLTLIGENDQATYARVDRLLTTRGDFDARETFFNLMFEHFDIRSGLAANFAPVIGARDTARMVFDEFGAELSELMGANMTPEQHAEFQDRYIETLEAFSEAKASFTEQFVMAAETIVGIGCAFIPGLQILSAKVLIGMFIAGGLMRVKMRDWMLGNEYNWDNQGSDFILGGIQMAANVLGPDFIISRLPVFKNVLAGAVDDLAAQGIRFVGAHADDFSRAVVNAIQAGGELSDDAALALVRKIGLGDEAASVIQQIVNSQIDDNFTRAGRLATEVLANVGTGSIAGGFTGGLDAALHIPEGADAYEALRYIFNAAAMGAASGAGGALAFTAGFKLVGRLFRGSNGETILNPSDDTTVVSSDGTLAPIENGEVTLRPGDRILVDGKPVEIDVQPLYGARNLQDNLPNATSDGAVNTYTPEEILATRGLDFPGGPNRDGDISFFQGARNYTPEQLSAIREFFANSEYAIANSEQYNQWLADADEIFSRWIASERTTAGVARQRATATSNLEISIRLLKSEAGENWPENLSPELIRENPTLLIDYLNSPEGVNLSHRNSSLANIDNFILRQQNVDAILQPRIAELQAFFDRVCKETGLPRVLLSSEHTSTTLGRYGRGIMLIDEVFLLYGRNAVDTVMHELLHHNQETLVLWRLADAFGITAATPPEWRLRTLVASYNQLTGGNMQINDPFLTELLSTRAGRSLTEAQTILADELRRTWIVPARTPGLRARIDAVVDSINLLTDSTGAVSNDAAAVQYARNYLQENIQQIIRAGNSGRNISQWTDEEIVANVVKFLRQERQTLSTQSANEFVQYAGRTDEWDAQMFGFLADDVTRNQLPNPPEELPSIPLRTSELGDNSMHALQDRSNFDASSQSQNRPRGEQQSDGSFLETTDSHSILRSPDGRVLETYRVNEDGSTTAFTYDDNGNLRTIRKTGETYTTTDGTTWTVTVNGEAPQQLDGTFRLEDDVIIYEEISPDGEILARISAYPDGTERVFVSDTVTDVYGTSGDLIRQERILQNGSIEHYNADGDLLVTFRELSDGSVINDYPDGHRRIEYPNGSVEDQFVDGRRRIIHADETAEIYHPDGSVNYLDSTGNVTRTRVNMPDGSVEMRFANGFERIISADIQFEQTRLRNFIDQTIQPPARAARMNELLSNMEEQLKLRGFPENQIAVMQREAYLILSAENAQMSMSLRQSLVEGMLHNVANAHRIWQGGNNACGFAGVEVRMIVRDPAAYLRALRMAAVEGEFSDALGRRIDLREINGALLPDNEAQRILNASSNDYTNAADIASNGDRNFASQIFEVLAGNERIYNNNRKLIKRYEKYNSRPSLPEGNVPNDTFERINTYEPILNEYFETTGANLVHGDPDVMNKTVGSDIAAIYNQITGAQDTFVIVRTISGESGPNMGEGTFSVKNEADLQTALLGMKNEGAFPVVVQIDVGASVFGQRQQSISGTVVSGPHALVIQDIRLDASGNYVLDATMQWGDEFNFLGDQAVSVANVWEALSSLRY